MGYLFAKYFRLRSSYRFLHADDALCVDASRCDLSRVWELGRRGCARRWPWRSSGRPFLLWR